MRARWDLVTLGCLLGLLAGCHRPPRAAPAAFLFEPAAKELGAVAARDPSVVVRASGEIFALSVRPAAGGGADLVLTRSEDGGDRFGADQVLNAAPGSVRSHLGGSPRLLLGPHSELYAVWADAGGLKVARSTNYGKSFGAPVEVPTGGRPPSFFDARLSGKGVLWIAWLGEVAGKPAASGSWVSAISSPDGVVFGAPVAVAGEVCPCCRPALIIDAKERVHLAFRLIHDGARDMAVVTSADQGKSWSSPALVSNDGWRIDGCPHSGPALAVAGGQLYVAWYSQAEGAPHLYWTRGPLEKAAFEPRRLLSADLLDANQPALVADGDEVFAVFQARDPRAKNGWGALGVYLWRLGSDQPPARAPSGGGSAGAPVLASLGAGRWLLAWTDRSKEGWVALARARAAGFAGAR